MQLNYELLIFLVIYIYIFLIIFLEVQIGFVISYDGGDDGDCGYGYVCFFYGDGVCIDVCYGDDGVYGDVGCGC